VQLHEFQRSQTSGYDWTFRDKRALWNDYRHDDFMARKCPYQVGGLLWVKESINRWADTELSVYAADGAETVADAWPWKRGALPGMFCPRGLSRITLRIADVRLERLQDISEADAKAEGVRASDAAVIVSDGHVVPEMANTYRGAFASLWDSINAKRATWQSNPFVWRISFERVN
jgi:hypothetical protein